LQTIEQSCRGGELFSIERDAPFGDHAFDLAAGRDPGAGEQLRDALRPRFAGLRSGETERRSLGGGAALGACSFVAVAKS
jgi:hypothetical protein